MNIYENIEPISKNEANEIFASNHTDNICRAMVAISFHEKDWEWAQDKCLHFFMNSTPEISGLAATCLGHIARVHHKIEKHKVIRILKSRLGDHAIKGQIEDALQDIEMFG